MLNGARRRERTVQGGDHVRKGSKEKDGRDAPSPRRRRAGVARAAPSGQAQREHVVGVSVGRATSPCRTRSTSRLRRGMAPPATRGPLDTSAKIDPSRQSPDRARARAPMTASRCAQGTRMRMQDPCHQRAPCHQHPWSTYRRRRSDRFSTPESRSQKTVCRPMSFESDFNKNRSELPFNLAPIRRKMASNFIAVVCQKKIRDCLSGVRVRAGDSGLV